MNKSDILHLPTSVCSWILLHDYFQEYGDSEVLYKIINDYVYELPLYEVDRLFTLFENAADDNVFQHALDYLFSYIASACC